VPESERVWINNLPTGWNLMSLEPIDDAIAFEEYRLQIVSRWPESDAKQDMLLRIESSLQRLLAERMHMRSARSEARNPPSTTVL